MLPLLRVGRALRRWFRAVALDTPACRNGCGCQQGPCSRYVTFNPCPIPPILPDSGPCQPIAPPPVRVCSDALCDIGGSGCPNDPMSIHPCGPQPRTIVVNGLCYRAFPEGDGRLHSEPVTNLPPGTVVLGTGDFQCAPLDQGCNDPRCRDDYSRLFIRATPCPGQGNEPRGVYICASSISNCGTFHVDHGAQGTWCYLNQGPAVLSHDIPSGSIVLPVDPANHQVPTCCGCLTGCQFVDIVNEPPCNPLASGADRCCYQSTDPVQLVAYSGGSTFNRDRQFPDFWQRYADTLETSPVGTVANPPIATIRRQGYIKNVGQPEVPDGPPSFYQLAVPGQPGFPNSGQSWPLAMANGGIARSCSPVCVAGGAGSICTVLHSVARSCFSLQGSATWESRAQDNFLQTDQNVSFLVAISPAGRCSGGCGGLQVIGGNGDGGGAGAGNGGCNGCGNEAGF